jgi:hypothetical protein
VLTLADDEMIVHHDPEWLRDLDDRFGHPTSAREGVGSPDG